MKPHGGVSAAMKTWRIEGGIGDGAAASWRQVAGGENSLAWLSGDSIDIKHGGKRRGISGVAKNAGCAKSVIINSNQSWHRRKRGSVAAYQRQHSGESSISMWHKAAAWRHAAAAAGMAKHRSKRNSVA